MAALFFTGAMSLNSCGPDDPEEPTKPEQPEVSQSSTYSFQYMNRTLEAGQTVYFHPDAEQLADDFAEVDFYMMNLTDQNQQTVMKVEHISGPASFGRIMLCLGECNQYICPWTSDVFTLTPGVNSNMKVAIEYSPSQATTDAVYRVTIGKGTAMEDPQVMLLNLSSN